MALRFALVAGEPSGDALAAGLIVALRQRFPDAVFEGVTGPKMQAAGCETIASMDELDLFGISGVIKHLPRLLKLRRQLYQRFTSQPVDVFIGIDSPAFNTGLEIKLRRAGIKTAHYVCPTVWAWREKRTIAIKKAVDRLLAIFPFEPEYLAAHGIDARFVGHPMADEIAIEPNAAQDREQLGLDSQTTYVGLLPGSRRSEVSRLGPIFVQAALQLQQKLPDVKFVAPMARPAVREIFEQVLQPYQNQLDVTLVDGQAREVMGASNGILVASGTATLEAMLTKTPMVVAYAVSPSNYWIAQALRLLKTDYVSMPNLLAGEMLVPEYIQNAADPKTLANALHNVLTTEAGQRQVERFYKMHATMALNANEQAAKVIAELVAS